ncbi:MAG: c-type cytochrome [Pseudomonadota bacterium]
MDSFELNKIAGAVLAALLLIFGTRTLVYELRHDKPLEQQAYIVDIPEEETATDAAAAEPVEEVEIATLLTSATVDAGAKVFRKCASCHANAPGAGARVGPNLHGVYNRDIGAAAGYAYSAALSEKQGNWDAEALNGFLKNPKGWAPGTKMIYAGLRRPEERANLIKYLESLK